MQAVDWRHHRLGQRHCHWIRILWWILKIFEWTTVSGSARKPNSNKSMDQILVGLENEGNHPSYAAHTKHLNCIGRRWFLVKISQSCDIFPSQFMKGLDVGKVLGWIDANMTIIACIWKHSGWKQHFNTCNSLPINTSVALRLKTMALIGPLLPFRWQWNWYWLFQDKRYEHRLL